MYFGISEQIQTLRDTFLQRGYIVMNRAFPESMLDQHSAGLSAFLLRNPEINSAHSDGDSHREVTARRRAFQWHSAEVLQLAVDARIMDALRALLLEEPFLLHVGTLSNDVSSRRNFLTQSSTSRQINAWIALKDVKVESGLLWVVPQSHHLTGNHFERLLRSQPELATRLAIMRESDASMDEWRQLERDYDEASDALLDSYIEEHRLERVPLMLQRGDVVIFSERLIHGRLSSSIKDGSRWCLVAQYGSLANPRSRYFDTDNIDEK